MEQWRIGALGERLVPVSIHSSITPVLHHSKSRLSGFSAPSKHNLHTLGFPDDSDSRGDFSRIAEVVFR